MRRQRWLLGVLGLLVAGASSSSASVIGYWRFDNDGGAAGSNINTALDSSGNGLNANRIGNAGGTLKYLSSSLPGVAIYDPLSGTSYANTMAAQVVNRTLRVPNNSLLSPTSPDTSFTFEFFLRIITEPGGYNSFARRVENGPNSPDNSASHDIRRWQVDFSHGKTKGSFGKIRSRWDTPQPGGDWNNVSFGDYVYVDTDSGSGNPNDYTGATGDVADEGDGINDLVEWHHVALVWDASSSQFTIYKDYQAGTTKTLNGTFVHPDTALDIVLGSGFEYYIDEIRYTAGALSSSQFLRAVPEPSSYATMAGLFGVALLVVRRRRRNRP